MFHICPETNRTGEILPHALIFPDTFLTFLDERFHSVFLNLILTIQSQLFLNFQLNRKTMRVPACLTRYIIALHGTVTRNHILDGTCQNVADMRFAVCRRRTVIKGINFSLFTIINTLLKNVFFVPELFDLLLTVYKIHAR